jgi:heptosyltransferase-2
LSSRILIVGAAWVGDAVLCQPLLATLAARTPQPEIHVLAPAFTHGVLARMPAVTRIIDSPFKHGELALAARWHLGRFLAQQHYSQAIVLPNSFKSAWVPYFARIPLRTGMVGEWRKGLLNDARVLDIKALPLMVERFASLAVTANTPVKRPVAAPQLAVEPAAQLLALQRLHLSTSQPIAVLCPGAEYGAAKRWPARHFAALARTWLAQGFQIWLMGSTKDALVADAVREGLTGSIHNLCGKTSLAEAVDLMALSERVVSNDSGLMHVAAALNRPLVAVFGSSSPTFTPPLSDRAHVVSLNLSCSPCFQRDCPLGHLNCLEQLTPERVLQVWP